MPASQGELLSTKSDDPNGTLITGLQNREKPFTQVLLLHQQLLIYVQACAFEEMAYIAYKNKERRLTIFMEEGQGRGTWSHILRACLDILAHINNNHQVPEGILTVINFCTDVCIEPGLLLSQNNVAPEQSEADKQVPIQQGNIFISRGIAKLPFEFVRSPDASNDAISLIPGFSTAQLKKKMDSLLGLRMFPITWPFRSCVEQKASKDLPHIRLAVVMVQGGQFFTNLSHNV